MSPPPGSPSERRLENLRRLCGYVGAPLLLFYLLSNFIIGSDRAVFFLDKHLPTFLSVPLMTYTEKQILHLEADFRRPSSQPRVVVVGSSSVVNGVDVGLVQSRLSACSPPPTVVNYGLTNLQASELPLLEGFLFRPGTEVVVFLYNTFSFGDSLFRGAARTRWNTREVLGSTILRTARRPDFDTLADGILGETFFVVRYRNLLRTTFLRAAAGRLPTTSSPYDYPEPENALYPWRPTVFEEAAPAISWYRAAYLASDSDRNTLGYLGLRRLLTQARQAGARVVLAPIPEPEFARGDKWNQDTRPERVDGRVAALAAEYNATYVPRDLVVDIESHDPYFLDRLHLGASGRKSYSEFLAATLLAVIGCGR